MTPAMTPAELAYYTEHTWTLPPDFTPADRALLAAAIRLGEALVELQAARDLVHEVADDYEHPRGWELSDLQQEANAAENARDSALTAYRAARSAP